MDYETILLDVEDGVATITLNRPHKKNCMNPRMHDEMTHLLEALRYDDSVRVLVFTGAGDSFCAGMDIKEFFVALKDKPHAYDRVERVASEWRGRTLRFYPKPTIAMVNGWCFGGGFANVEGCDLAFAADDAQFGLSEINFRMLPGGAVAKSMANLMRPRDAMLYALTGRNFDGRKAAEIGLVNASFPRESLRAETMQVAREIAAKDAWALKGAKESYRYALEMSWDASISYVNAKGWELEKVQNTTWIGGAADDFVAGKYRPGLEGHETLRDEGQP
ncbi:p-hydroxycinnamoyl CoA hydratase/lyase [Variovorax defluvii]|uniref:p-hydroxycinnamoyl CoA hydratase/lyase n=1 Tax=Variovorax defluvii TaxID=913761 RepID=A0ABP8ICB4_9BURK